jgi:alpha-galactosidase
MAHFELKLTQFSLPVEADSIQPLQQGWLLNGGSLALSLPYEPRLMYRHGFHSWSQAGWLDLQRQHSPPLLRHLWPQQDDPALLADYPFASSGVIAFEIGDNRILLVGALAMDTHLEWRAPRLSASIQPRPPAGDLRWYLAEGSELDVFNGYAQLLSEAFSSHATDTAPRVWCSWYSLYRQISEPQLLHILRELHGLPFDVFQVDDGWQQHIGHWQPNAQFPSGMPELAGAIRKAGYTPGLWLAPFIAAPSAPVFQQHPDWFIRDETGAPLPAGENWGGPYYGLDVTHPHAQRWLQDVIRQVVAWGFTYLKLDFLYGAALHGARSQVIGSEQAYRLGLQLVRQAAGPHAYILACGAPILATLGLANGLRIGPDVTPFWDNYDRTHYLSDPTGPSCRNALSTSLSRLWLKPLLHTDPDVVFFRTRYNLLQPDEKLVLQRLAQACGFFATSDLPAWLDADERQALQVFLSHRPSVERLSRYHVALDGQAFDFESYLQG